MDDFSCSLSHPIYDLLSNKTRLEILRIIACEKNYGSRIASILKISAPAIHRHLKILSQTLKDPDIDDYSFLKPSYRTSESYSGYKGAEATVYEIGTKMYLVFAIYPNFVHSHAFLVPVDNKDNIEKEAPQDQLETTDKKERTDKDSTKAASTKENRKKFSELYNEIQNKNEKINQLEHEILRIFEEKDELMKALDEILEKDLLDFDERISLRTLACQGESCFSNLPELLKQDEEVVKKILRNLRAKEWLNVLGKGIEIEL